MTFNPAAIPTIVLAEILFAAGSFAERKTRSRFVRMAFLVLGAVAAAPGILILVDYAHFFNSPAWFYAFRTAPYTELTVAGLGWIVGYCYSLMGPEGTGEKAVWPIGLFVLTSIPFIKPISIQST
jgi:hypothetical protein